MAGLLDPAVTFFSYRTAGERLAVGVLKRLNRRHAESVQVEFLAGTAPARLPPALAAP